MGYKTNGVNTGGLPMHLVEPLIAKYNVPFFIECGTASGDSARMAAELFGHVWTIELIEGRQETEDAKDNITWLVGDSVELLPKIISHVKSLRVPNEFALFYLDAHYSGNTPNETGYPECPVLKEIKIIQKMI